MATLLSIRSSHATRNAMAPLQTALLSQMRAQMLLWERQLDQHFVIEAADFERDILGEAMILVMDSFSTAADEFLPSYSGASQSDLE